MSWLTQYPSTNITPLQSNEYSIPLAAHIVNLLYYGLTARNGVHHPQLGNDRSFSPIQCHAIV